MDSANTAAVVNVVNRYALAVDTRRWDLFDSIFDDSAEVDFGFGAIWNGREAVKDAFRSIHDGYDATVHTTTNHVVGIDGDSAHCLSYVHGRFIKQIDGSGAEFESAGWYDDTLRHGGGGWLITRRVCTMVWTRGNPQVLGLPADTATDSATTVLTPLQVAAGNNTIGYLRAVESPTAQ